MNLQSFMWVLKRCKGASNLTAAMLGNATLSFSLTSYCWQQRFICGSASVSCFVLALFLIDFHYTMSSVLPFRLQLAVKRDMNSVTRKWSFSMDGEYEESVVLVHSFIDSSSVSSKYFLFIYCGSHTLINIFAHTITEYIRKWAAH